MTAITIPRQPHSEWLARLRSVALGLGGRGVLGLGLGRSSVSAAAVPTVDWSQWFTYFWLFKGAASQAVSYVDELAGLTMTSTNEPTWSAATGLTFNGSAQYMDIKFIATNNMAVMLQFTGAAAGTGAETSLIGHYKASGTRFQLGKQGSTNAVVYASGSLSYVAPMIAAGNLAINGSGSSVLGYRNGVSETTNLGGPGVSTQTLLLGARRREDLSGIDLYTAFTAVALGIRITSLDAAQMLAAATAMAAL